MIKTAIAKVKDGYKALVIYNEGSQFSAGANLGLALFAANTALWPMIEDMVSQGQKAYRALKYAPFPVVAAPSGLALGGGCEILLYADAVQAHTESYVGLVEAGVGIVPAWGGCTAMLARYAADPRRPKGPGGAGCPGVRDNRPGQGRQVGVRGARARLPAARRRHHVQP